MAESAGDRPPEFWAGVAEDYAANRLPLVEIFKKYALTEGQFNHARKRLGWAKRRRYAPTRQNILKRLFMLVDRLTTELESNMTTAGEKEVTVLGRLVHTMGKLIEIEAASERTPTERQTKDMNDIRSKLAARIAELKRG